MYLIKRTSKVPASPMRVLVDAARPDADGSQGFARGGAFIFQPAGDPQGLDQATVTAHVARVIMSDPGLRVHFECTPPIQDTAEAAPKPAQDGGQDELDPAPRKGRRRDG